MKTKNPFRGIAHTNGSSYNQRYFRHVEGARDWRPRWGKSRHYASNDGSFRDINPVPAGFCE